MGLVVWPKMNKEVLVKMTKNLNDTRKSLLVKYKSQEHNHMICLLLHFPINGDENQV